MADEDDDVWQAYTRRVTPKGARKPQSPKPVARVKPVATPLHLPAAVAPVHLAAPVLFDRRTEKRFRDGAIRIDARIDLHGLTRDKAYTALAHFLNAQVKAGARKLLIITGQGRGREGVLRTQLPGWLESFSAARHIIDLRGAAPRHGGAGAFYVWLRKAK